MYPDISRGSRGDVNAICIIFYLEFEKENSEMNFSSWSVATIFCIIFFFINFVFLLFLLPSLVISTLRNF